MGVHLWQKKGVAGVEPALQVSAYYPPFYPLLAGLLCVTLGSGLRPFYFLFNFLSVLLTAWLLIFLGSREKDLQRGLLAASFFLWLPATWFLSTRAFLEAGLLPLVTLLAWLLYAEPMRTRKGLAVMALLVATGFLTKWTFLFFALFPVAVALARLPIKERFLRGAYLAGIFFILIYPWLYANDFKLFRLLYFANQLGTMTGDPLPSSWKFYAYYPLRIVMDLLGPLSLLLVLSLVRSPFPYGWWLGVSVLLLTLSYNKDPRFLMPIVPVALYQAFYGLSRASFLTVVVFFLLAQVLFLWRTLPDLFPKRVALPIEAIAYELSPLVPGKATVGIIDSKKEIHPYLLQYGLIQSRIRRNASLDFSVLLRGAGRCQAKVLLIRGSMPCPGYMRRGVIGSMEVWLKRNGVN